MIEMIVYQKARKVHQNSTYGCFLVFVLESTLVVAAFKPPEDSKLLLKDGYINLRQNFKWFSNIDQL